MPKENQLHEPTEAAKCADVQEYLKGTLQVCERALGGWKKKDFHKR